LPCPRPKVPRRLQSRCCSPLYAGTSRLRGALVFADPLINPLSRPPRLPSRAPPLRLPPSARREPRLRLVASKAVEGVRRRAEHAPRADRPRSFDGPSLSDRKGYPRRVTADPGHGFLGVKSAGEVMAFASRVATVGGAKPAKGGGGSHADGKTTPRKRQSHSRSQTPAEAARELGRPLLSAELQGAITI